MSPYHGQRAMPRISLDLIKDKAKPLCSSTFFSWLIFYKKCIQPGVMAQAFSFSIWEAEAGRCLCVTGQPGGHSETLSQNLKDKYTKKV